MWIPILFLKKWSFILVTHSCWLLDMFDNLLWWPSVYFMNLVRIINHLLNHLIKPCNKIVAVNRITGENVVPTSGAACCLNNLIIILDGFCLEDIHTLQHHFQWFLICLKPMTWTSFPQTQPWHMIYIFNICPEVFLPLIIITSIFVALFLHTYWILPHLLHYWNSSMLITFIRSSPCFHSCNPSLNLH